MTTDGAPRATPSAVVIAGLVGIAVYVLIDVALALLRPDYSLLRNYESDYSRGRFCWLMDINFVLRGVLTAVAAIALKRSGLASTWVAALVWIWAGASAFLAFFPDNPAGYPHLWTGAVHLALAFIAFLAIAVATTAMSFRRSAHASVALRILSIIGAVSFLLLAHPFGAGGLIERIFLAAQLAWLGVATGLSRHVRSDQT